MTDAVLLVHGLGGTSYDLGGLPMALQKIGLVVHTLTLPGHGGVPTDLNHVVMEDWLQAVADQHAQLLQTHRVVHLVGMCMGALLVCEVAQQKQASSGKLVLLAPTLHLDGWGMPWYHVFRRLHYVLPWLRTSFRIKEEHPYGIKNARLRAIVQKRFERGDSFHYGWMPLQSIWQLDRLRQKVMQGLSRVTAPTLVMHPREDEYASVRSAQFLCAGLGTDKAQLVILENSYHMVCVDNDRGIVEQQVVEFLRGSI